MASSLWPFGEIVEQIGETARQVLPNEIEKRKLDLQEQEIQQRTDLGQIEVNKAEATHANLFVAGWRPFIGWTGGFSLLYTFIVGPLIEQIFGANMPDLDVWELIALVGAMLGVGTMRTFEKTRGVATSVNGTVPVPRRPLPADLEGLV